MEQRVIYFTSARPHKRLHVRLWVRSMCQFTAASNFVGTGHLIRAVNLEREHKGAVCFGRI